MDKVIRDGKVAVLISPGFGAGWYTWNGPNQDCLFHPIIVAAVESNQPSEVIEELAEKLFGSGFYAGGARGLEIQWLPENTQFVIEEYDGSESIRTTRDLTIIA